MPAWGDLINQLQLNGLKVDAAQQAIQVRDLELKQRQEMYSLDKQYREAVTRGLKLDPNLANPNTPSLSQAEWDSMTPEEREVRQLQGDYRKKSADLALATLYKQDKAVAHLTTEVDNIRTNLREAQKAAIGEKEKRDTQTANILRDVDGPDSLRNGLIRIADYDLPMAQRLYKQLPRDDEGNPVWNETARGIIKPYVSERTSMAQNERNQKDEMSLVMQQLRLAEKQREALERELQGRQRIALKQAGKGEAASGVGGGFEKWREKLDPTQQKMLNDDAWNFMLYKIQPQRKGKGNDYNEKVRLEAARISNEMNASGIEVANLSDDHKSQMKSLGPLIQKYDAVKASFESLHNNIDTWNKVAEGQIPKYGSAEFKAMGDRFKKIDFTGVKSLDEIRLKIKQEFGDGATAAYLYGASSVAMDVARIRQGAQSVASLTEGSAERALKDIPAGLGPAGRQGVIASAVSDSEGVIAGLEKQIGERRKSMGMTPLTTLIARKGAGGGAEQDKMREAAVKSWGSYDPDKYDYEWNPQTGRLRRAKKE